ncbi:Mediator of RNA polymerase II transcription subunit 23-like protein [Drosera capensis]
MYVKSVGALSEKKGGKQSLSVQDLSSWQEWLIFADIFHFLIKSGCIDFVDFLDKLVLRLVEGDQPHLRTNHITWLLAQIIRIEHVINAINGDPKKVDLTRKLLSFHREEKSSDHNNPHSILLDFISSCQNLRIWSLNPATREYLNNEQLQKGKQIDEWWRQVSKGERPVEYTNLDERSIGMYWVVSFMMAQPACDTIMNWLTSAGTEMLSTSGLQSNDRLMIMRETSPLPMSLLSGFAINLCFKLAHQMEDTLFSGQILPSVGMVETYTRILLIAPHSLFRSHFSHLTQKNPSALSKPNTTLLVLEILNYRLLPLYSLFIITSNFSNMMMNLRSISLPMALLEKAYAYVSVLWLNFSSWVMQCLYSAGSTEFTETLNRVTVITLAIIIKTRGIAEAEHLYLPTMLEQIMGSSQHMWSDKTLRYFPPALRDALIGRVDKRGLAIQAWQQAEATVINQCTNLLSPSADPTYVMTYVSHSFPQHKQYLCAGAWILMHGHPENINSANLARVLREFSPEEVTANIYTLVDVLLHHVHVELQHGHLLQDLLLKACMNLAFFIWTHELLPLDILLLALIDRDDDPHALHIVISLLERQELQQRIKLFAVVRGPPEHWLINGIFKRGELHKALGSHLSGKDRFPVFFDDIAARLLPVIPLIVYRLIENDAMEHAERVLAMYRPLLVYHPLRFTFVRDILAYFYGHLPGKLIIRILNVLDIGKIPFADSFPSYIQQIPAPPAPSADYFATLLFSLVNNVVAPFSMNPKPGSLSDGSYHSARIVHNKVAPQSGPTKAGDGHKAFYQLQDPGTYTQLVLETAVIELLSLPVSAAYIVSSLVNFVIHIQPTLIQSSSGTLGGANSAGQTFALPTSPSGGSTDSMNTSRPNQPSSGINTSNFVSRSGYTYQQLSCLLIQACGLLLAQLPQEFHIQLYIEVSRLLKESWWLEDGNKLPSELESAVNYALLDPSWAVQDNTSTAIGNMVALLHSFFSNLAQEWLEGAHLIIKNLRPVASVAMLRIAFRIIGPLLPRLANAHTLFNKTLSLLLSILVDVFGKNSQIPTQASEITDLIDFFHHVIHYEGQGGPVQPNSRARLEVLALFSRASESLRPDVQHFLSHLKTDVNSSIYAATHPKLVQNLVQVNKTWWT